MKVLLVSSWDTPCGIAEHSAYLKEAIEKADPSIQIVPSAAALDPAYGLSVADRYDAVILNYHRALHSRWTVEQVAKIPNPVITIWHDSFGENPPDELTVRLAQTVEAFIVHEPVIGVPNATYWRMGVPELSGDVGLQPMNYHARPIVGTMGFAFPWKCWVELAEAAEDAGWGLQIITPAITPEQMAPILRANPYTTFHGGLNRRMALSALATSDATAFTFVCANSGQSASILQGIGARKPVIAFHTCRQFRALWELERNSSMAIQWVETFAQVRDALRYSPALGRFDSGIVHLAHHESWTQLGHKYARLLKEITS